MAEGRVRVLRFRDARPGHGEEVVRIDVSHPDGTLKGIDMTADVFDLPDEKALAAGLAVLNANIADWPVEPITCEQVRALADG